MAAFADDLLFAETKEGLQVFLNHVYEVLQSLGTKVNLLKFFTISLISSDKEKKVRTNQTTFFINQTPIRALSVGEEFEYLGITFTREGKVKSSVTANLVQEYCRF